MEWSEEVLIMKDCLQCNERTAESIVKKLSMAGIDEISEVKRIEDKIYHILEIKNKNGDTFYAFIGRGYFLEEIRKDSLEGERIFHAIR